MKGDYVRGRERGRKLWEEKTDRQKDILRQRSKDNRIDRQEIKTGKETYSDR